MKNGLVLEGGGLRGNFTAGVLDYFNDNNMEFDYVIGVSAGACNAVSYLSKQRGRNLRISQEYAQDPRYIGLKNFIKTGSLFGMEFIFDEIPNKLDKFDYDTFFDNPAEFYIGVTDAMTGLPNYIKSEKGKDINTALKASSALPIFSKIIDYEGKKYLDGGTSDPIPVRRAFEDGCDHVTVVLTQHRGYRKKAESHRKVYEKVFRKYPGMIRCLNKRHLVYNETLEFIKEMESQGKVTVISPKDPVKVGRFDNEPEKLLELYNIGYNVAKEIYEK